MPSREQRNPDAETALLVALQGLQSKMWTAMPGIIQSFDSAKQTVVVQVAIQLQQQQPNGSWVNVSVAPLLDVVAIFPGGGGFVLTFPIAPGDECLVVFASRCIDSWWQSGGVQPQAELRMHNLSDGFAVLGVRSQPRRILNLNNVATQLRNETGNVYVEVNGTGVKLKGAVVIDGTLVANGVIIDQRHTHGGVTPGGGTSGIVTP